MTARSRHATAEWGLVALTVIWGVNFSVVKAVLGHLDPLALNALRFPLAACVLWLPLRGLPRPTVDRADRNRLVALGILGNVAYQMFFILGIDATLAGNASLLLATSPVWTVLLSAAAGHERPGRLVFLGSGVTLAGMVLVVLGGRQALGFDVGSLRGDALMVGAALLWSVYTVGSSRLVGKFGPLRVTAWTLWIGTPFIVAAGLPALAATGLSRLPAWVWGGVAYAGVFSVGIAYLLWYRGVHRLGNARTAIYSNLVPVAALLTAWLWLGEVPGTLQLVGAAVVLGGISLARAARRSHSPEGIDLRWRTSGNS